MRLFRNCNCDRISRFIISSKRVSAELFHSFFNHLNALSIGKIVKKGGVKIYAKTVILSACANDVTNAVYRLPLALGVHFCKAFFGFRFKIRLGFHKSLEVKVLQLVEGLFCKVLHFLTGKSFGCKVGIRADDSFQLVENRFHRILDRLPQRAIFSLQLGKLFVGFRIGEHRRHGIGNNLFKSLAIKRGFARKGFAVDLIAFLQLGNFSVDESIHINVLFAVFLKKELRKSAELLIIVFRDKVRDLVRERIQANACAEVSSIDVDIDLVAVFEIAVGCCALLAVYDGYALSVFHLALKHVDLKRRHFRNGANTVQRGFLRVGEGAFFDNGAVIVNAVFCRLLRGDIPLFARGVVVVSAALFSIVLTKTKSTLFLYVGKMKLVKPFSVTDRTV